MATTHEDYKISRLPNTFYRISKTSHFLVMTHTSIIFISMVTKKILVNIHTKNV